MEGIVLFALPGNEDLTKKLADQLDAEVGEVTVRHFPDGETYIRIHTEIKDKQVVLVSTLNQPDKKMLPLYFLSKTAKEMGAVSTCLISPYLAYMRQDKKFNPGEAVTSEFFGSLISNFADSLITIDPHLHRRSSLSEVYNIPNSVGHAANHISNWIKNNMDNPVLVGPDSESEQWVSEVAKNADAPFIVLEKIRHGDNDVEVSVPNIEKYKEHTPVLVDDIISTARTMIETVNHLKMASMKAPVCIGIHAVFSSTAYLDLIDSGVESVVTCNTIPHESNRIDISDILVKSYKELNSDNR